MADLSNRTSADRRLAALFPEEGAVDRRPRWRRKRTVVIALAVVAALLVAGAVTGTAFGSSGSSYRTATVGPQQVDSVLTGVATIEPVAQAAVAFPVAGTVASVNVKIGDPVVAGGVLASLDTQSLEQTMHTKQASLAQAQLTLEKALSGQSVSTGGSGGSGSGASGGGTGAATVTPAAYRSGTTTSTGATIVLTAATVSAAGPPPDPLTAAQHAVLTAQQQVDAAMQASDAAIAAESTACAAFLGASASGAPGAPGGATAATTPDATACQQAITAVQTAQQALAAAQHALQTASTALDTLLAQRAATPPPTTPTTTTPARSGTGTTGAAAASGGTASSSRTSTTAGSSPSAADLVAYQASVDAASYAEIAAQQAVDAAIISSPLAGTVVGVNMKVGDSITAGSSTENVVVEGQGGYEIATSVSVDNIPSVSVGQDATVTPDGSHQTLTGKVVAISLVPASTTTTSTLYHVIVGLTNPGASLHDGATGTVAILTKHTRAALAVPTSAVTTTRGRHTVTVLANGTASPVLVQVGAMGATWTEIKSGLTAGQQVVLADVSAPLPGSATATATTGQTTTRGFGGLGGGRGFGGLGGGAGGRNG